ncbi:MAG TPA: LysR family transcriptional regulator, partial [Xanthobacteraceae bacterium]|nr:LysR family transcriptional regulator [Xanthobacteraceae bacterium]
MAAVAFGAMSAEHSPRAPNVPSRKRREGPMPPKQQNKAGLERGQRSKSPQPRVAPRSAAPSHKRLRPPRLLTYVDAVARHGSIRKAADALNVASSALNRQILDLESDLGSALFERLPRGVRLTAAGEVFLAYVRQ